MIKILILFVLPSLVFTSDIISVQFSGVDVSHKDTELVVKRNSPPECKEISLTAENILSENLSADRIPLKCKKSNIITFGSVQPMSIDKDIRTFGELEVLRFLEILEFNSDKYALIDARRSYWYESMTLPGSVNISYYGLRENKRHTEDYTRALELLNVKKDKDNNLDFSQAKEIVLFCNASWCVQSVWAIKSLIKMGYPKNKIAWYRGGLQDWVGLGFTTVKP